MSLKPEELERLADYLLRDEFEDKRKNKSRTREFPILSPSQIKRRESMEIPYSSLSEAQRLACRKQKMDYYPREDD